MMFSKRVVCLAILTLSTKPNLREQQWVTGDQLYPLAGAAGFRRKYAPIVVTAVAKTGRIPLKACRNGSGDRSFQDFSFNPISLTQTSALNSDWKK